jgi:hypothetical protein
MKQAQAITAKIKAGKVKNPYAAKNKVKKLKQIESLNKWLAQ